jgi:hypothetical protein
MIFSWKNNYHKVCRKIAVYRVICRYREQPPPFLKYEVLEKGKTMNGSIMIDQEQTFDEY